jgi:hypothetical protein
VPTYPDKVRAAERAEIRSRYRRKRKAGISALRVAELDREFSDRYGGQLLVDDDAGRDDVRIMLNHIARRPGDPAPYMVAWLDRRAPWCAGEERAALITRTIAKPLRYRADTLARKIGLTAARRKRLTIHTIGAVDMTAEQRAAERREQQRLAKEQKRRAAGVPTIAEARAKRAKKSPWIEAGLARSTWYRHHQRAA